MITDIYVVEFQFVIRLNGNWEYCQVGHEFTHSHDHAIKCGNVIHMVLAITSACAVARNHRKRQSDNGNGNKDSFYF